MRYWKDLEPLRILCLLVLVFAVACGGGNTEDSGYETTEPETQEAETQEAAPAIKVATATLQGQEGSNISGTVTFTQSPDGGAVTIQAEVRGMDGAGMHGFHIHETGDCTAADFTSAGGHFNPTNAPHGGPDDAEHHAGDLGNIEIGADGTGTLDLASSMLTLDAGAPNSTVGKAVILHAGEDDLETQPTGDAGARLACGVVQLSM